MRAPRGGRPTLAGAGAALAALVMSTGACYERPAVRPPAPAIHPHGARPILESADAIRYLPAQTELVIAARTLEIAERTRAMSALGAIMADGRLGPRRTLARAGVDPEAPLGGFVLDANHRVVGAFGRLADRGRLDGFVAAEADARGEAVTVRAHGEAVVLSGGNRSSWRVVIRDRSVFFLSSRRDTTLLDDAARAISSSEPSGGLAASVRFRVLLRELEGGSDVAVFVRSAALLQRALGIWDRQADRLFGSLPGAAAGIDIEGDRARVAGFIAVRPDSLIDRVQGSSRGETPLAYGTPTATPPIAITGWFRRDRIGELARGILSMTPDPIEAEAKLEETVGGDLDARVFPALSGELAWSWVPSGWAAFATIAPDSQIDLPLVAPADGDAWTVAIAKDCPRKGERCLAVSGRSGDPALLAAEAVGPRGPNVSGAAWSFTLDLGRLPDEDGVDSAGWLSLNGRRAAEGLVFEGSFPVSATRGPLESRPGSR